MGEFYNDQWRLPNNENKDKSSNYSMSFDGSSQYIEFQEINLGTVQSTSLWVKRNDNSQLECLISGINGWGLSGLAIVAHSNGKLYLQVSGNSAASGNFGNVFGTRPAGIWYHICITRNGNSATLYIDGVSINTINLSVNGDFKVNGIGASIVNGSQYETGGKIDHVAIFDYALSSSQVTSLYGNSTNGVGNPMSLSTKPVAYYKLGEKAAFNGSEYLVTNAASEVYSPYALDFDGSNDYITLSNITIFTDFSLSFWYKKDSAVGGIDAVVGKDTIDGGILTSIAFTSGKLHFKNRPGSWTALTTTLSSNTEFKHYSITYNSTANELKGYCNGVLEVTTTPVFSGATGSEHSFNRIGRYSSANYLDGKLTNLSTFNSPLTSSQVTEIYNQGKPSNLNNHSAYSNLVSWWQLGENMSYDGTNWTVLDEKGTNNGTSANMGEDAIVNGVGTTANGLSSGMGSGDNVIGEAPYSTANALSIDMGVEARTDDTPS